MHVPTLIVLLAGVVAASADSGQGSSDQAARLTAADNARVVEVQVGQRLEVVLKGNPTTGYRWSVAAPAPGVVEQLGEPEYAPDSNAIGAGGQFTFRFRAVSKGRAKLKLIYQRPFAKDEPPDESFEITIAVEKPSGR